MMMELDLTPLPGRSRRARACEQVKYACVFPFDSFVYLFSCSGSQLQPVGMGSRSPSRGQALAPCTGIVQAESPDHGESRCACGVFFFPFIFISWRLITLQYCSGFCHTLT